MGRRNSLTRAHRFAPRSALSRRERAPYPSIFPVSQPCPLLRITAVLLRLLITTMFLLAAAEPGWTLPIFARRYGTSCTTCHVMPPKLNAFGIAFRNNGYRIPLNEEKFIEAPDVAL